MVGEGRGGEGRVRYWGKEGVRWCGELMRGAGIWGKGVDEMRGKDSVGEESWEGSLGEGRSVEG